jgi:hypothetical protein
VREYDDDRYLEWHSQFQALVSEFLDTEGNTEASLQDEFESAIENAAA